MRRGRGAERSHESRRESETDWPESVRVVASQPSLWWNHPDLAPDPGRRPGAARRGGPTRPISVAAGPTMVEELGQSFYLMGLMALVLSSFVGLGLLAVRVLG